MIRDIGTVLWKEWHEWLIPLDGLRGALLRQGLLLLVVGVFVPLQLGADWIDSPIPLFYAGWTPFFIVSTLVADSFAGERERHTLETLLATRLPDRALLLGKSGAVIAYAWGLTVASNLLGWATVAIADGGDLRFYSLLTTVGIVVLSLLGAALSAGIGILVSLRATTVRQAQQILSAGLLLLILIPVLALQFAPAAWLDAISAALDPLSPGALLAWVCGALLLIDAALLAVAMARFRRSRLTLD